MRKVLTTLVREPTRAAIELATFKRPAYSLAMLADFAGIGLDIAATTQRGAQCAPCTESGSWGLFVGRRPAAHKVALVGIGEALLTMTASHYFVRTSTFWPVRFAAVGVPAAEAGIHAYYAAENWRLISDCQAAGLRCH